jgi:hypothetical protein
MPTAEQGAHGGGEGWALGDEVVFFAGVGAQVEEVLAGVA